MRIDEGSIAPQDDATYYIKLWEGRMHVLDVGAASTCGVKKERKSQFHTFFLNNSSDAT